MTDGGFFWAWTGHDPEYTQWLHDQYAIATLLSETVPVARPLAMRTRLTLWLKRLFNR